MNKDTLLAKLHEPRPGLEAEGVAHLGLFGSRAREDHSDSSDADILIDVFQEARFSILDLVGVEHIVLDATGIPANAFMRRSLDAPFGNSISSEVIEIF